MRLTCPNCGAQYEVPDEVIPADGRDVQCSNCGDTWFQVHPDHPLTPQETVESSPGTEPDPDLKTEFGPDDQDLHEGVEGREPTAGAPEFEDRENAPSPPEPPRPRLDESVREVLRKEAEREAELRAAEAGDLASGLESQPELGLDTGDVAARRAEEARARMARLRGVPASGQTPHPFQDDPDTGDSRRGLLPDIEEINSTLKSDSAAVPHGDSAPRAEVEAGRRRSGFSRGFAISLLLAAFLLLIYSNAPRIAQAVPQVDPMLNAYVTMVDSARLWLDSQIGRLAGR